MTEFKRNLPDPKDDMFESISDFQDTWNNIADTFGVDHYTFDDSVTANRGKHRKATFVEQSAGEIGAIVPATNEIVMYSKESNSKTELFVKNELGTEIQITKDSAVYLGLVPHAACNFLGDGMVQADFNASTVVRNPGNRGMNTYQIIFDNPASSNDYLVDVQGFDNGSGPVVANIARDATYGNVVKTGSVIVQFVDQNGDAKNDMVAGMVTVWKVQ